MIRASARAALRTVRGLEPLRRRLALRIRGRRCPRAELHRLRITCKRARYAVELFEPALGEGAKPIEKALIDVQDHLGALQDAVVALATVEEVRRDYSASLSQPEDTALADYAFQLTQRRDHLHQTFTPLWERISGLPFASCSRPCSRACDTLLES